ncbi:MAG: transcription termination/antitermination protein NusA [Lachnospiraceae bacterium]|nr:transcription termination/antitermination protein NusA [Lachnospiraceae bacterium]
MNKELMEALDLLEKEKGISRDPIFDAIDASLKKACTEMYGTTDNIDVSIDRETCDYRIIQYKTVVESVEKGKANAQITLEKAREIDPAAGYGDTVGVELKTREFGRIAAQNAKSIILQKIREEERQTVADYYNARAHEIMTGIVQRVNNGIVSINLGKADAVLKAEDIIPGETFEPTQHVKVYVVGMRDGGKGPRVEITRTKPAMVRKLFEMEVSEMREGIVEIKAISREAGSRTKMAVWSNDPNIDPIGACIGVNGSRINPIVNELHGEKIDIVQWNENPALFVENALSPAKVVAVAVDEDENSALVVVPDNQLSLAIGMKGQNARLAARLTGFKIDIKSESQARDEGLFDDYEENYGEEETYEETAEDGDAGEDAGEDAGYGDEYGGEEEAPDGAADAPEDGEEA